MALTKILEENSPSEKRDEEDNEYNPTYALVEDHLSSMRCACACNPGPPDPYCGPTPCGPGPGGPPKCSQKITYKK